MPKLPPHMLRTALILLVTCLALSGAFAIYVATQPATRLADRPESHPPAPPMPINPGDGPYKNGGTGGLEQYDGKTGRISSEMRWTSFTRHQDGTTTVIAPAISLNVGDGQRLLIVGETGQIDNFHAPAMTAMTAKAPVGMPDRGTLQHVHIYLYPSWDNKADPNIILTTENLAFDNATFRIATAAYTDEHGKSIAADQVPVHVTGDYLFDGRGLTVQWNDRDSRLELLEVAHGEQLTILHPKKAFGATSGSAHPATEPAAAPGDSDEPVVIHWTGPLRVTPAVDLPATAPSTRQAKPPQPPYLARFFYSVLVTQGLQTHITADAMDVAFALKQSAGATTRPAPRRGAAAGSPASTPVAVAPIAPAPFDLTPGTAVVTLYGQPVIARHMDLAQLQTVEARAAQMVYYTADGSASLRPGPALPTVRITRFDNSIGDTPTARVSGEYFDYIGRNQEAVFTGPGQAQLPAGADGGKAMDASWQQSAKVFMTSTAHGQSAVSRAVLQGDVNVSHPQLSLQSQSLELLFSPPPTSAGRQTASSQSPQTSSGALAKVIATGSVNCRLTDTAGKKQTIDCQKLDVRMGHAGASEYPRQIFADGDVHAFDAQQELQAGHVELALVPAPSKPPKSADHAGMRAADPAAAVAMRSLYAADHVRLRGKADQLATCDELLVDGDPAQAGRVELIGHNSLATVTDHANVLSGPTIVMNSATHQDSIIGPGTLHILHQNATGAPAGAHAKPANPIDVIWSDRAVVNGPANAVDAYGKVVITQTAEDKSVDTARSPHLHIDLEDKPIPAPLDHSPRSGAAGGSAADPSTQPMLVAGPSTDIFKNKQAKSVTLDQGVEITSTLNDPATGVLLRDMLLRAPTVVYQLGPAPGQETLQVPVAGQMLVRDYRNDDTAAGSGATHSVPAAQPAAADLHGARGLTAFSWEKSLTYTAVDRQAVMLGNVHVKHQDNDQSDPAELVAQRVVAHFRADKTPDKNSPADNQTALGPMQLQNLHAEQDLVITHSGTKVTGTSMDFDPVTHDLTIHGSEATPVVESSPTNADITQALSAKWNTQTWNIDFSDVTARGKTK